MRSSKLDLGILPGSFDPCTLGHVSLVHRFLKQFSEIILLVASNKQKNYWFSLEERKQMCIEVFKSIPEIHVDVLETGLVAEFSKRKSCPYLLRGIRNESDSIYEKKLAKINKTIFPEIETYFLTAEFNESHISSELVKKEAHQSNDLSKLLPECLKKIVEEKAKNRVR